MNFISEEESAALVSHEIAFQAAREALVAVVDDAVIFPAVLAHGSSPTNRFSIKSASTSSFAGLKVGSFWPSNPERGLPRHNSLILLFDQSTGRVEWAIEAGKVNAFRTAAADAVAADALARKDASVLAIFGAGNQALYEFRATFAAASVIEVFVRIESSLTKVLRLHVADMEKAVAANAKIDKRRLDTRLQIDNGALVNVADVRVLARAFNIELFQQAILQDGDAALFRLGNIDQNFLFHVISLVFGAAPHQAGQACAMG
jgi:ornithine cyclodeaminase